MENRKKSGANKTSLSDEARKARNKYMREYRDKNKDKVAEYNRNYWERQVQESQEDK